MGSRFTKVPERNPALGVLSLVGGLIPVALLFLPYAHQDRYLSLLHLAGGLAVFLEAALYFLPDDQLRYKVALRAAQIVWGVFVIVPLSLMAFESLFFSHSR